MSLFRKEAIDHQSECLTSDISLAQPLSIKLTVSILTFVAILIISLLLKAQYKIQIAFQNDEIKI